MASSGSITVAVTSHDNLIFEWVVASQSVADNTSTVTWTLTLTADSSGRINSSLEKEWTVTVNGTTYTGTNYIGISSNSSKVIIEGETVIPHNVDGTKTFSYSFTQQIEVSFSGSFIESKSGSGTGTLDPIARGATITSAPNFTDEDNPTIVYSNPAGDIVESLRACISFDGTVADIEYRDIPVNGTTYTFELTNAERSILQNGTVTSNTRTVYFYVRSVVGGNVFSSKLAKTLTIVNCSPTLSPTIKDVNSTATGLTGDDSKFILHYSNAQYSIGAQVFKGATIKEQSCSVGGVTVYDSSGTINGVTGAIFTFSVTDSRGNTVSKTLERTAIEYIKVTCDLDATNPTGDGDATLVIEGNYFNGSFGSNVNSITVRYRYKVNNGSYGEWVIVTPTFSTNRYSATVNLSGLNYQDAYTFQASALDLLTSVSSVEKTVRSIPIFDWGPEDFKFNVPVSAPVVSTERLDVDDLTLLSAEIANVEVTTNLNAESATIANLYDNSGRKIMNGLTMYETAGIDPNTTLDHLILTHINTPGGAYMYVKTEFYGDKTETSNRMQTAFYYKQSGMPYFRYYFDNAWTEWTQFYTPVTNSTAEKLTGEIWIDGKPIYRRVVEFSTSTTGSTVAISGPTITGFESLVSIRGVVSRTGSSASHFPLTFYYSSSNYHTVWLTSTGEFKVRTSSEINCAVIVEYTKTS